MLQPGAILESMLARLVYRGTIYTIRTIDEIATNDETSPRPNTAFE